MSIKIVVAGVLILFMIGFGAGFLSSGSPEVVAQGSQSYSYVYGSEQSQNRLLRLDIMGPILGTPPDDISDPFGFLGFSGLTFGYEIKDAFRKAAEDPTIKGIFLHISTPGGTIFGSMAIHEGIKKFQEETGKPVVAFVEGMSASGGVMAMAVVRAARVAQRAHSRAMQVPAA